jgi:hypothetical protein
MLKTAHLLAAWLLLSSVMIANTATAESLRDVMSNTPYQQGNNPSGQLFSVTHARTTRPHFNQGGRTVVDETARAEWETGTSAGHGAALFTPGPALTSLWDQMARDVQNLPTSSGVAAYTYTRDPQTGNLAPTSQGLGAIFGDRAQTSGKGKWNIGTDWSHIVYENLNGTSLRRYYLDDATIDEATAFTGRNSNGFFENRAWVIVHTDPGAGGTGFPDAGVTFNVDPASNCGLNAVGGTIIGRNECTGTTADGFSYRARGPWGKYTTEALPRESLDTNIHFDVEHVNFYLAYGLTDTVDIGLTVPVIKSELVVDVDFFPASQLAGKNSDYSGIKDCIDAFDHQCNYDKYRDYMLFSFSDKTNLLNGGANIVQPPKSIPDKGMMYHFGVSNRAFFITDRLEGDNNLAIIPKETVSNSGVDNGLGDIKLRGKWNFLQNPFVDLAARVDASFPTGSENNFRGTGEYIFNTTLIASKTFNWFSPHANVGVDYSPSGGGRYSMLRVALGADLSLHERAAASVSFLGNKFLKVSGHKTPQLAVAPGIKLRLMKSLLLKGSAIIRLNSEGLRAKVLPTLGVEYVFF